jgi:outer membrane protein assembly factor BamB
MRVIQRIRYLMSVFALIAVAVTVFSLSASTSLSKQNSKLKTAAIDANDSKPKRKSQVLSKQNSKPKTAAIDANDSKIKGKSQVATAKLVQDNTKRASWSSFRNGNEQQGVAYSKLPLKLVKLWEAPAQDGVLGAPAIVGEHVFVGILGGELLCLDRETGDLIWSYKSVKKVPKNSFAPGFLASPTVTDDSVYIGDEDGVFHAINRKTGKQRWVYQTFAEIISSASIVGKTVIFGSYDSNLYCLNMDGTLNWKYETMDRVNGSPAVSNGFSFVTGCDEHLRVINILTGKQEYEMNLRTYLIASPAIKGDMLYVGTYASEVIAVDWKKQEVLWRYKNEDNDFPYHSSAALTEKYVVVGGRDKQLHCIDRATGKGVWTYPTRGRIDSSPVVVGKRVFVGCSDGNLYEVGLEDGKLLWKFNALKEIAGSPAIGEGVLVFGTAAGDGMIYCFGAAE